MNLGTTIKECRKLKKMTQGQLAERVGCSVSHLSLVESNKRHPSVPVAEIMAEALGMPLCVLIFIAEERKNLPELTVRHINDLSMNVKSLMVQRRISEKDFPPEINNIIHGLG